jgi:uncharacterized OB-fold protein
MIEGTYLGMALELNERETHQVPYFGYCAEGEFRLQRCAGCGLLRYPPGTACPWCACAAAEWVAVEGRGTVHSYMEAHHSFQPAFRPFLPYTVLLVDLDTQKGIPTAHEALRVIGNLVDSEGWLAPPELVGRVGIGSRVRMVFTAVAAGLALPQWTCDDMAPHSAPWRYPE